MPDRGYLGGLAYELPTNRYVQSPVAPVVDAGAAPFLQVPEAVDGLAQVEGLTDKYIDTRGKIEAYALDMQKRYGIDVTQPDYTQPGGGLPHKTFRNLATDLLVIANDLKQRRETEKTILPQLLAGNVRGVEGYDLTAPNAQNQFYSTKLLDEVEQANQILRTAVHTEADQKRFKEQVADPLIARLTQQMNAEGTTPSQKEFLRMNINALVQTPRSTPYAAFRNTGSGRKPTVEIDLLKKVTNLANAKWAPGTYQPDTDEQGNPVLVTTAMNGEQAGEYVYEDNKGIQKRVPRVLAGLVKKGDGVYFKFQQQGDVEIPDVKVSSKKGDEIAASIISSNPKYGSVNKMYEAMRETGLADETGSLVNEKVLAGEEFDTPEASSFGAGISAEKSRLKTLIDEGNKNDPAGNLFVNRPKIPITLPSGEQVTLVKHRKGDGWFVSELEDESEDFTHMDWSDIERWLADEKYFNKFLTQETTSSPTEPDPLKKKAQDLINKYTQ